MNRRGFTLIEVIMALVVLVIVMTGLGRFVGNFVHTSATSAVRLTATTVAQERLERVRADPRYDLLTTLYGTGAGADSTGAPGYATLRRRTTVTRDVSGAPARDFTTVTVRVTHPAMRDTVAVTATLARP